jgi:hypothetical protein
MKGEAKKWSWGESHTHKKKNERRGKTKKGEKLEGEARCQNKGGTHKRREKNLQKINEEREKQKKKRLSVTVKLPSSNASKRKVHADEAKPDAAARLTRAKVRQEQCVQVPALKGSSQGTIRRYQQPT